MAKSSGGTRGASGGAGFGRATQALYNAIGSGDKSAISAAKSKVANMISKMSTEQVKNAAEEVSFSAALTGDRKSMPKSEWNPTTAKYNNTLAKLYTQEANKRS